MPADGISLATVLAEPVDPVASRRRLSVDTAEMSIALRASFASPIVDVKLSLHASTNGQMDAHAVPVDLTAVSPSALFWVPRLTSSERAALLNYGGGLRQHCVP